VRLHDLLSVYRPFTQIAAHWQLLPVAEQCDATGIDQLHDAACRQRANPQSMNRQAIHPEDRLL